MSTHSLQIIIQNTAQSLLNIINDNRPSPSLRIKGCEVPTENISEKNYLNVRLEKGEKEKRLTIRLLPMDPKGGSPFVHVHFHTVEVNEALVKPGQRPYKSYMCLNPHYNPNIDHETFGNRCPFCENNKDAYEKSLKATTPEEKKMR